MLLTAINSYQLMWVAPARERGLKYLIPVLADLVSMVAPARERGLKY